MSAACKGGGCCTRCSPGGDGYVFGYRTIYVVFGDDGLMDAASVERLGKGRIVAVLENAHINSFHRASVLVEESP